MSAEKYVLTPSQFAKKEKITVETLKKRRQRGFYDGKFSVANGKYYYVDRASKIGSSPGTLAARPRRRGAHLEGQETRYPNLAFKQHNDLKIIARIKHNIGPSVLDELTPEAVAVAKQNLLKKREQRLKTAINKKNYGGMLNNGEYNLQLQKERRRKNFLEFQRENNYNRGNSFFIHGNRGNPYGYNTDDLTDVVPSRSNDKPRFNNKVEEAIYYAKRRH